MSVPIHLLHIPSHHIYENGGACSREGMELHVTPQSSRTRRCWLTPSEGVSPHTRRSMGSSTNFSSPRLLKQFAERPCTLQEPSQKAGSLLISASLTADSCLHNWKQSKVEPSYEYSHTGRNLRGERDRSRLQAAADFYLGVSERGVAPPGPRPRPASAAAAALLQSKSDIFHTSFIEAAPRKGHYIIRPQK